MKLVREHINEKFREDSDPIKDLGIGINLERIKKWMHEETTYDNRYDDYLIAICTLFDKRDYINYLIDELGFDINEYGSLALRVAIIDYNNKNKEELIDFLVNMGATLSGEYIENVKERSPYEFELIKKYYLK